jgi:uncharacterized ion transporter superfamily protein YfcC
MRLPHAVVMMLIIIGATAFLTWVIPSGQFERGESGLVVPGTYHRVAKERTLAVFVAPKKSSETVAYPAGPVAAIAAIPAGMVKVAQLITMIFFIGGMFGVLNESGALESGVERLLSATRGNVALVAMTFMIVLAAGSSFLGLISEYLVVIPIALVVAERLGKSALFGTAMVTIAAKIGYLTSVTNPLALAVAQPIVGVPVLSGAGFRAITLAAFLPVGIWYLLRRSRSEELIDQNVPTGDSRLSARHSMVLIVLALSVVVMLIGVQKFDWESGELAAMYIALAMVIAVAGRMSSREASQAFIKGMQGMVLAALLVGLASAVEIILRNAMILDTVIASLTRTVEGRHPVVVANFMMFVQMVIDVFIPSTSGKAAVTMPILGPIGQLSGVSGQVSVQAFLFGNGLMNTLTPTSGMLLAYLATGKVTYGQWIRFVLPLALILLMMCSIALTIAVLIGL